MRIENEKQLADILDEDVTLTDKQHIIFFAGHFPLTYDENGAFEDINRWGEFSKYTLELACKAAKTAESSGKRVSFVFFADDHTYEGDNDLGTTQVKQRRKRLYKSASGDLARLPEEYQRIMETFGYDETDVIRHDHGKEGRRDCLYFSEKILRYQGRDIDNLCAKEYLKFLEDPRYFNKEDDHLVSFIPMRCKNNICDVALDLEIKEISASHIFIESLALGCDREGLYHAGRGVMYRKDQD